MSCKEPFRFAELIKPFRLYLVFEMTFDMMNDLLMTLARSQFH